MAKRNFVQRNSFWVEEQVEVSDVLQEEKVPLQLQKDVILNINGPVTGTPYHFNRAGSIVLVYKADVDEMMKKQSGSACCSGTPPLPYFKRLV